LKSTSLLPRSVFFFLIVTEDFHANFSLQNLQSCANSSKLNVQFNQLGKEHKANSRNLFFATFSFSISWKHVRSGVGDERQMRKLRVQTNLFTRTFVVPNNSGRQFKRGTHHSMLRYPLAQQ
jgi:hypothetical protein